MFFFLTIGAYGWYSLKPGWRRYVVVAVFFACGLASKSMLVTLPFVLLVLDYWPLGRIRGLTAPSALHSSRASFGTLFLEKLPLLTLSIAASVVAVVAQGHGGAVATVQRFPLQGRLENAIYSYAAYVWKTFWPARLAPLYPHPGNSLAGWKVTLAAVFLIAVSGLVFKLRTRSYLLAGWLFFLGTLVPVIGFVQVGSQAMADRYAYLPCLGIIVMAVMGASDLADSKKLGRPLRVAIAACILVAISAVSYRQIGYWKDSLTLWSHALAVTQNNFLAEDGVGGALIQEGRAEEAYPHFQHAARIVPDDPISHAAIGAYLQQHLRFAEAIQQYQIVVHLACTPGLRALEYANLGLSLIHIFTVTTMNVELARILEPRAPRPDLRIEAVRELSAAGINVGVSSSPVLPAITDAPADLEAVVRAAAEAGAMHIFAGPLFLKPCSAAVFLPFLEDVYKRQR